MSTMKKTIFIGIVLLTLFSFLASADIIWTDDFEDGDCSDWGGCTIVTGGLQNNGTYAGKLIAVATEVFSPSYNIVDDQNFNVTIWANLTEAVGGSYSTFSVVNNYWEDGAMAFWEAGFGACASHEFCDFDDATDTYQTTGFAVPYRQWVKYTFEFNTSGNTGLFNFYADDVLVKANMRGRSNTFNRNNMRRISTKQVSGNMYVDDMSIYNKTIPDTSSIVINNTFPLNNTQYSSATININTSVFGIIPGTFNCSLYLNDVLNHTWTDQTNSTTFLGVDKIFPSSSTIEYYFNCTSGIIETISDINTFYTDTEDPIIFTDFIEGQIAFNKNITGEFIFSDSFLLYSYNVSIDGNQISALDNLGVVDIGYNLSYDVSTLSAGIHTLTARIADGHTAKEIPDYSVSDGLFNNYLKYTFPDNEYIKIEKEDGSMFDKFTTEKKKDRYSFNFEPNDNTKTVYSFLVTSSQKLNIIKTDSKYKNYIISGNQWLDFISLEDKESKIKIKLLSDYSAQVTVSELKPKDKFSFNSIGELNIIEQNFTFTTVNATITYINPVVETQSHLTTITFDITDTGLTNNNFTVSLDYNGTAGTLLETTDSLTYVKYSSTLTAPTVDAISIAIFNWSINISGNTGEFVYNHTIYEISVDDCSNHVGDGNWTEALHFISLNEEGNGTEYVEDTTLNIDLKVWVEDESDYNDFSFGFTGGNNYSICIYPNSSTYLVNSVSEYFAPQMANRKYYLDNYYLNATSRTVYLYNLNSSKASDITIRVYDKNTAEPVPGAYVKILRYYPETGSYRTVEIERTDGNGYTLGKMVLANVFYKFIVETDRTVRLDSSIERIISLSKNLGIVQGSDLMESWRKILSVNTLVSCNNQTKQCLFTWSDTNNLVQEVTLKVYRFNGYGKTEIYQASSSSVAGTLFYTIDEDTTGNSYTATGYIETNTANSFYVVGEAYLEYLTNMHDKFGVSGVLPIMLLIIAVGAAFLETGAVGVVAGSLIGLAIMALTGFVSFGFTTIVTFIIIGGILIAKLRA